MKNKLNVFDYTTTKIWRPNNDTFASFKPSQVMKREGAYPFHDPTSN